MSGTTPVADPPAAEPSPSDPTAAPHPAAPHPAAPSASSAASSIDPADPPASHAAPPRGVAARGREPIYEYDAESRARRFWPAVMAQLHAAVASRERVWALAAGRYRATHARTVLGGVWWFLDPLLHLAALSIVMAALELPPVTVPGPDGSPRPVPYVLFLATAMVPWKWFTASLTRGAFAVIESRPLFVQVRLAAIEPVLAALLQEAWHLLIGLGVFALIAAAFGYMPGPSLAALPALLLVQATFQTALALLLSVGCFFFRDLANVLPLGLTLLMYLSPVIYSLDRVSPAFRPFFEANPMAVLIGAYRDVLLAGAWPQPAPLAAVAAGSFVLLLIAARRFDRAEGDFSKSA